MTITRRPLFAALATMVALGFAPPAVAQAKTDFKVA